MGEAQWCGDFEAAEEVVPEEPLQGAYQCEHCLDGQWFVTDATPQGDCPKCGEPCLPF